MPLIVAEPETRSMQTILERDPSMLVWWTTEIECTGAISRREREGLLTAEQSARAVNRLEVLRKAWNEIDPVAVIRRTAIRLVRVHPLRTGDALQLAAALVACEGDPGSLEIVTLDERLADAARREGLTLLLA